MPKSEYGVCCHDERDCSNYNTNFCSFDAPRDSKTLQLWACPHTPRYCGEHTLTANIKGNSQMLRPRQHSNYHLWFKGGEACKYKIAFPAAANKYDQIAVLVKKLDNTRIMTASTRRYKNEEFTEAEL